MIHNDRVYGSPLVLYKDTQANIEALSGLEAGAEAYATDIKKFGTFNGSSWDWSSGGSAGYAELLMEDGVTFPPVPLTNEAGDDWVYNA